MKDEPFIRADRLSQIKVSPIIAVSEAARRRAEAGHKVINLGIGEPDFDTPDNANEAAIAAIHAHDSHYPPVAGKPELRSAIAALYHGRGGISRKPEHVIVSGGAKYALLNAFMASLNAGDEVIIPVPCWVSYADMVRLCGGVPVFIETSLENGFKPKPEHIARAMTERTRWLLLNSPNNPGGGVLNANELTAIGEVLASHPGCWLLSDEIYEHITYGTAFASVADCLPHLASRTLIISGVSKTYAMTGWRLGYGVGPKALIDAMTIVQAQGTAGTATISQAAALAAITGDQHIRQERQTIFQARRDLVCSRINQTQGLTAPIPDGAFYVFPSWKARHGWKTPDGKRLATDIDFCTYILEAANVAVVPGEAFMMPGHFRLSTASSEDDLATAMTRLIHAVDALAP